MHSCSCSPRCVLYLTCVDARAMCNVFVKLVCALPRVRACAPLEVFAQAPSPFAAQQQYCCDCAHRSHIERAHHFMPRRGQTSPCATIGCHTAMRPPRELRWPCAISPTMAGCTVPLAFARTVTAIVDDDTQDALLEEGGAQAVPEAGRLPAELVHAAAALQRLPDHGATDATWRSRLLSLLRHPACRWSTDAACRSGLMERSLVSLQDLVSQHATLLEPGEERVAGLVTSACCLLAAALICPLESPHSRVRGGRAALRRGHVRHGGRAVVRCAAPHCHGGVPGPWCPRHANSGSRIVSCSTRRAQRHRCCAGGCAPGVAAGAGVQPAVVLVLSASAACAQHPGGGSACALRSRHGHSR